MADTSFLENYRNAVGYVAGSPSWQAASKFLRFTPMAQKIPRVDWTGQNKGVDAGRRDSLQKYTEIPPKEVASNEKGAPLLNSTKTIPKLIGNADTKRLWRLDGKKANVQEYENKLSKIKQEINSSQSLKDTVSVLKRYAKDWDLNMYLLGTDSGRTQKYYDWTPVNMFREEINAYENPTEETWPEGYTNDQWKKYLNETIDSHLSVKNIRINPESIKLS